jgi:pimeloyl-ACP methyl ester carboxylesterase
VSDAGVTHLRSAIPHAEVVRVEAAGHMVVGDANDQFATSINAFLRKVVASE